MTNTPHDRLTSLREKIDRQRNTIELLKRDGHECADAERQLRQMIADLHNSESLPQRP